jgi:N-acetylglucosamine-6-phosphate deacetylase
MNTFMHENKMKAIINTHIVLADHIIYGGKILFDQKGIIDYGDIPIPPQAELIDAHGCYTGPGFVDIHCHGGGGYWFYDKPEEAARYFLAHGTTTILPALYVNLTLDGYLQAYEKIARAMCRGAGRIIKAIYMEGPYLNPKYGCDSKNNQWSGGIKRSDYRKLLEAADSLVKVWCIAPERKGIEEFVCEAAKDNVIFSVAHSEASPEQVFHFLPYGLKLQTHHTNATGVRSVIAGVREPGVDEAALLCDDIYIELICDSKAVHVRPHMLKLALKVKGKDKIILISDATEFGSAGDKNLNAAPDIRYDDDGNVAGSALTLNQACRNMMKHTGVGICDVFRFSSLNPASLLGLQHRIGRIEKGFESNLVIVDDMINIKHVFFRGEQVV